MIKLFRSTGLVAISLLAAALVSGAALAQQKVLKFIPQADLRILDPITTTAYITRNHGYMVYDTLFATDAKFQVQPQMVDKYEVSNDKLTYTFTLRDGLKFHDGAAGALGRLHRLDRALGQARRARPEAGRSRPSRGRPSTTRPSRSSSRSRSRSTLEALAKPSSNVPFIMPERIAKTDAFDQHHRADRLGPVQVRQGGMGAGQQGRLREEHRLRAAQGAAVVGGRRQGRQGRSRRVDLHSGFGHRRGRAQRGRSRLVGADAARPDPGARARTRDVKVENIDPLGSMGMLRFNFLYPPFNNQKMRQALLYAVDQNDYVLGIAGDLKNGHPCYSYFTCGTPLSSEVGAEPLKGKRDFEKAKQLIKEAGYKGEKIVIIDATDQPIVHSQSLLTAEMLTQARPQRRAAGGRLGHADHAPRVEGAGRQRRLVDLPHLARRPRHGHPGGQFRRSAASGEKAWFGWPDDAKIEELREAWFDATDAAARRRRRTRCRRARSSSCRTSRPAQFILPTAYRTNLSG